MKFSAMLLPFKELIWSQWTREGTAQLQSEGHAFCADLRDAVLQGDWPVILS